MSVWFMAQRATAPPLVAQLLGGDGAPVNLAGATVRVQTYPSIGAPALLDTPATVTDALHGTVQYNWSAGGTATAGEFLMQWWVTFAGGQLERFPTPGYDLLHVDAS